MNRTRYYQPFGHNTQPPYYHKPPFNPSYTPNDSEAHLTPYELYAKPAQPMDLFYSNEGGDSFPGNPEQPPPGILGAFTDEKGQVNLDKTMTTINQLASTYHQITPIVKQIGSLINAFR